MRAARSEYEAHEMLLDSVGTTGTLAHLFASIRPAPKRAPARASHTISVSVWRLRLFFSVRLVRPSPASQMGATMAGACLACIVLVLSGCGGGDYCDDPAPGTAAECGGVACTVCRGYAAVQPTMSIPARPASAAGI